MNLRIARFDDPRMAVYHVLYARRSSYFVFKFVRQRRNETHHAAQDQDGGSNERALSHFGPTAKTGSPNLKTAVSGLPRLCIVSLVWVD